MNDIRGGRVTSYMGDIQPWQRSEEGRSRDRADLVDAQTKGGELGDPLTRIDSLFTRTGASTTLLLAISVLLRSNSRAR